MPVANVPVPDLNPRVIAQRLRTIRQARGMSQTDVAAAAKINLGNYNEIEHAKRQSFQVKILYRLCHVLGVRPDYLLGLSDDPTPQWTRHEVAPSDTSP